MTMCDWIATTGKPVGRQEWADTHLDLTLELADHLRRCHDANPDYTENSPPLVSRISVSS